MVDGVEGSSQVKQTECGVLVSCKQKVIVDLQDGGHSAIEPAIRSLHSRHQVTTVQKYF